jgi:PQQ-like domain
MVAPLLAETSKGGSAAGVQTAAKNRTGESAAGPQTTDKSRTARATEEREWAKSVPLPTDRDKTEDLEGRFEADSRRYTYPTGRIPAGDWQAAAMEHIRKYVPDGVPNGVSTLPVGSSSPNAVVPVGANWTMIGPSPLDTLGTTNNAYQYGDTVGRINALAFDPTNPSIAYAGPVVGGLWRTTNCCSASTTWTSLWSDETFPNNSIGAITIDSVNPNIIYVGTGDAQVPYYDMFGDGIYKSTDAGKTWYHYGGSLMSPYGSPGAPGTACCNPAPDQNIKSIVIDPRNHNTLLAGGSYGVFISYDAGVTWTQVDVVNRNVAPFTTSAQRVTSMLIDGNTNPSTVYVALGYPYSSSRRAGLIGGANGVYSAPVPTSGAPTFTLRANGFPAGTGNGTSPPTAGAANVGRIELAWNATHTHMYAHVAQYTAANVGMTLGIYHLNMATMTWNLLTGTADTNFKTCGTPAGQETAQAWYDLTLDMDPLNDTIMYTGRTNLWKVTLNSPTAPTSATLLDLSAVYSTSCAAYGSCHPDQHSFAFQPGSNPTRFLVGNDGAVYYGTGAAGGFTRTLTNIAALQFYAGQIGRDFANTSGTTTQWAFGGMQDNGNASWDSSQTNFRWIGRSIGGDGFFTAFDPIAGTRTAGRWMTEYTNGATYCSTGGAAGPFAACAPAYAGTEREEWSTPYIADQWNCTATTCGNVVLGTSNVWASVNMGGAWTKVWATDISKGGARDDAISINVAHNNPGSVIIGTSSGDVQWSNNVFTGANCTLPASNTATFACTANTASTFVNLTGANAVLPNRMITGVVFDPTTNLTFYAAVSGFNSNTPATPGHVFRGTCAASPCTPANFTWVNKTSNLPDIPVEGIQVNPSNAKQVFIGSNLGFFYTNDITVATPIWNRYQTGMPNTRIAYLAVDRGVAATPRTSTALSAWTYGRSVYVTKIGLPTCDAPTAPTGVTATGAGPITVSWTASPTATSYNVYRSGPGTACPANGYTLLGSVTAPTVSYVDSTFPGGGTYSYRVTAVVSTCESQVSNCSSSTVPGSCLVPPTFGGVTSAVVATGTSCGITLGWTEGTSSCGGALSYNIYRGAAGFTPSTATRVAQGATGSSYTDTAGLAASTLYEYIVRAVDSSNSVEESNVVRRSATTAAGCTVAPLVVQAFTVTSTGGSAATSGQNVLEWWNPASLPGASTITINYRLDQYPTGPADTAAVVALSGRAAAVGTVDSFTHTGLTLANKYYYSIWVIQGALNSSDRNASGRPQDTTTATLPVRWMFSTGASALSPPGGSVTVVSNDRFYHNMIPGQTAGGAGVGSGTWPSTWKPFVMNAPVQNRPRVVTATIGTATKVAFLGSQDGKAWVVNADTGASVWSTAVLGTMIQAGISGVLTQFGQSYDTMLVPTRNASGANYIFGIDALTGATQWQYPATGTNLIGVVNGASSIDATVPGAYKVYFASRALDATNNGTVWCLSFTNAAAVPCTGWPAKVALGDIDGSVIRANGALYVGTNSGIVYALDPSTGGVLWSNNLGDGPIKSYPWPVYGSSPNIFYVATTSKVTKLTYTSGPSAAVTWSYNIAGPSLPYYASGSTALYVGSSDGKLHQLTNLSLASPTDTPLTLGDGASTVGSPASDSSGQVNVGTDQGTIYSLTIPY